MVNYVRFKGDELLQANRAELFSKWLSMYYHVCRITTPVYMANPVIIVLVNRYYWQYALACAMALILPYSLLLCLSITHYWHGHCGIVGGILDGIKNAGTVNGLVQLLKLIALNSEWVLRRVIHHLLMVDLQKLLIFSFQGIVGQGDRTSVLGWSSNLVTD